MNEKISLEEVSWNFVEIGANKEKGSKIVLIL